MTADASGECTLCRERCNLFFSVYLSNSDSLSSRGYPMFRVSTLSLYVLCTSAFPILHIEICLYSRSTALFKKGVSWKHGSMDSSRGQEHEGILLMQGTEAR